MKTKKLEKKVLFIFKRNVVSLSREQMKKLNGGNFNTTEGGGDLSTLPGCVEDKPTVATISF